MAKGKSANPADAHRKAMRAKEVKKNKEERKKVRETITVKKDIGGLEAEVRRLTEGERTISLDKASQLRLSELREELTRIKKAKEEYLALHPEHRHLVYPNEERERLRKEQDAQERADSGAAGGPRLGGRGRDPTRSVYYDPVLNPFGAPPPGMPYMEKPFPMGLPAEANVEEDEDEDESEDSDDDIVMPDGPPPDDPNADSDSDDDSIVMPEGTPPPEARLPVPAQLPNRPQGFQQFPPGFRPPFRPYQNQHQNQPGYQSRPLPAFQSQRGNFPAVLVGGALPPRPPLGQQFPSYGHHQQQPGGPAPYFPTPPPGFFPNNSANNNFGGPSQSGQYQQRPHQPFVQRGPAQPVSDPLSDVPHQTYQAHRLARREESKAESDLPKKPDGETTKPVSQAEATISAAPQLRDFRKEAAAFVPRAAKKKKTAAAVTTTSEPVATLIDSAPNSLETSYGEPTGASQSSVYEIHAAPGRVPDPAPAPNVAPAYNPSMAGGGLFSALTSVLGPLPSTTATPVAKPGDDYKAFLAGLEKLA